MGNAFVVLLSKVYVQCIKNLMVQLSLTLMAFCNLFIVGLSPLSL